MFIVYLSMTMKVKFKSWYLRRIGTDTMSRGKKMWLLKQRIPVSFMVLIF